MLIKRSIKGLVIGLVAFILASITYAYAASNTVDNNKAGDGSAGISGYTVTAVTYTLDSSNPVNVTMAQITLNSSAATVKIRLATGGTLFPCSGGPTVWNCPISGVTVTGATNLEVVAAQ
ncbi:MAG TPA: hypothetical protein VMC09_08035 [Anaerolineales bacterium]|nr:hypothetical protein [Anaerolineales bacterium]